MNKPKKIKVLLSVPPYNCVNSTTPTVPPTSAFIVGVAAPLPCPFTEFIASIKAAALLFPIFVEALAWNLINWLLVPSKVPVSAVSDET